MYGDGSEGNPYSISNAEQLLNIKYFATDKKYFALVNTINLKDGVTEYSTASGVIIAETFNGVLNGNEHSIGNFVEVYNGVQTINIKNANKFALFGTLADATIKNLTIGNSDSTIKIVNSFDEDNSNVVQLSLIATGANRSTISNIVVHDFVIEISAEETKTLSGGLMLAGLVVTATNSNFTNCTINMINVKLGTNIVLEGNDKSSYIAGLVAESKASTYSIINIFKENSVDSGFIIQGYSTSMVTYVGGVIAYFEGNAGYNYSISDANINVCAKDVQVYRLGGIVGYGSYVEIVSGKTSGTMSYESAVNAFAIGGIIGYANNLKLEKVATNIEFKFAGIIGSVNNQFLGAIAGSLNGNGNVNGWSGPTGTDFNTTIENGNVKLGCYGYKVDAITVVKNN